MTRTRGSVPEGLISTLPSPANSASSFRMASAITGYSMYYSFLWLATLAFTSACGSTSIIWASSERLLPVSTMT